MQTRTQTQHTKQHVLASVPTCPPHSHILTTPSGKTHEALRQLINTLINQSANATTLQYYMFIVFPVVL